MAEAKVEDGQPHAGHADAAHHAEHVPGTMDITDQQKTFDGFLRFWVLVFGASIFILIFLALFNS